MGGRQWYIGYNIFDDSKAAEEMFHAKAKSFQCAAVFGFSITKERHDIILERKRPRTVLERMQGKPKLMDTLTKYFSTTVVPAYAKQQRTRTPTHKKVPSVSPMDQI